MKNKLLLAAALSLFPFAALAKNANIYKAELTRFQIDDGLHFDESDVTGGEVVVDLKANKVRVTLFRKSNCPQNAMCIAMLPGPYIVELPILAKTKDNCGTGIVQARTPEAIPGGLIQQLEVRDNSRNKCPHFVALSPTEVIYETSRVVVPSSNNAHTYSKFEGERLEAVNK